MLDPMSRHQTDKSCRMRYHCTGEVQVTEFETCQNKMRVSNAIRGELACPRHTHRSSHGRLLFPLPFLAADEPPSLGTSGGG